MRKLIDLNKKFAWIALLCCATIAIFHALPQKSFAVTAADWRAGNIIDDALFYDKNSMSVGEIQAFLNGKVPVCDTAGSKPSEYGGGTRAQYGASKGYPAPFVCLKDYYENPSTKANNLHGNPIPAGGISAAQIIWNVSQQFGVSPKVMLVMLHKESDRLMIDDWPWSTQYRTAMGYGCPDSGPNYSANCNPNDYGFYTQMYSAARQFRLYANSPSSYNYIAGRNNTIQYNPDPSCGSSVVYIENQATAGLYNYTPYQPNQAALNAGYGTAPCGAYGNRNFWKLYNDWFGSTHGSGYSWSIESFTYAGGDNIINQNDSETVTLKARNTGRFPWYNHGNHPVRIGTWLPDRTSTMASNNWASSTRPSTLVENSVAPGAIGTFTFQLNPKQLGTFVEGFNLVAENALWMDWPGFSPTIQVGNGYSWNIQNVVYNSGTGLMEPGTSQLITVIAKNTGNKTWSKQSGPPIYLGTWEPERKSQVGQNWISQTRLVTMNETTVAPGQNAGFQFYVRMPSTGTFYERINLVAEGQSWFNDAGLTLYLDGGTYAWQPLWVNHSTGTANISRGTNFTLTVKAKNIGNMPWRKSTGFPVRLGTAAPFNRGTALYQSSWIKDNRPVGLTEEVVNPGQEGTFTFLAKAPDATGPKVERFSLLAEGLVWMNDPNFSIYVNSY
ncbi:MAG: hypothetical protein U0520_04700 [Candidatus Saccharimonadales bacterium]